jgi:hypothetical protein
VQVALVYSRMLQHSLALSFLCVLLVLVVVDFILQSGPDSVHVNTVKAACSCAITVATCCVVC